MPYSKSKVYFDGSHYIAIPKELQTPHKRKMKTIKKENQVLNETKEQESLGATKNRVNSEVMATAKIDLNELFETLYRNNLDKKPREKYEKIFEGLKSYIKNEERLKEFIHKNLDRKIRNAIERRKRLYRKVNLNTWSYFCTFTYDSNKHTEESFRTKLSNTLKHLASRKGWRYIGVWERSPVNDRLHFHALVYTPIMIGKFKEKQDYSTKNHKMQTTYQNSHFLKKFGRNDFKPIDERELAQSIKYLTKYIEKSKEKIVYSKAVATYFVSDIIEDDIVCHIGIEDKKLLLFDDFNCWDEGVLIGKVNKEVIDKMPKAN